VRTRPSGPCLLVRRAGGSGPYPAKSCRASEAGRGSRLVAGTASSQARRWWSRYDIISPIEEAANSGPTGEVEIEPRQRRCS
jgi:hypothetical protein